MEKKQLTESQPTRKPNQVLEKQKLAYTSHYCEENVYKACQYYHQQTTSQYRQQHPAYAVVITTPSKKTNIRQQKGGKNPQDDFKVNWDYHVIMLVKSKVSGGVNVFDFDSRLDWGVALTQYYQRALTTTMFEDTIHYRVFSSDRYLDNFASDRSHMMRRGRYVMPPPSYPNIVNKKGTTMNLMDILDTNNKDLNLGIWVEGHKLLQLLGVPKL